MVWLARSNYEVHVPASNFVEVVLFNLGKRNPGMEDMRLVRFVDADESVRYMGTYTALNDPQFCAVDGISGTGHDRWNQNG